MTKIKLLHISKYYPPYIGGVESFCYDIVTALDKTNKYEQIVLCYNDCNQTKVENFDGIKVIRVGIQKIIASQPIAFGYEKELKQILHNFCPQIIHFIYPNPFAAHFFLKNEFKCIFHLDWICDIIKQKYIKKLFYRQNLRLINKANIITSITPTYFNDTDYLPSYKGYKDYIPCRIGDDRMNFTEQQTRKADEIRKTYENKKIVFFFGRHTEYKGLKYLIDSDKYLNQNRIQILIGGQGELTNQLKERAKLYKNIEFVGKLSNDDVNSYLQACDIFAFPSITRNEAFGISLAEAMYFGKPACTFTIPGSGVNWVSPNNVTGLEAPNKDIKSYAENITRLVEDPILYARLSENAKQRCIDYFTLECFEKKVVDVYNRLSGFIQ